MEIVLRFWLATKRTLAAVAGGDMLLLGAEPQPRRKILASRKKTGARGLVGIGLLLPARGLETATLL